MVSSRQSAAGSVALPFALTVAVAFSLGFVPSDYLFDAVLTPFLAISLAGLGLNLLAGYAGQVSLGSAAFMAIGAFGTYNLLLRVPGLPLLAAIVIAGLITAVCGVVFGLPSLRLRGFYLAVATLAAQFVVEWALNTFNWFSGGDTSGVVQTPPLMIGAFAVNSPARRYIVCLSVVAVLTAIAIRLVHSRMGRELLTVRDNETAARILGVKILRRKLLACAVSSFYIGVAGALWAFFYLRTIEPAGFDLDRSFEILFVIIIGGLASIRGAFLGAALLVILPLLLSRAGAAVFGATFDSGLVDIVEKIILGALIIVFLRAEPSGLSALLARARIPFRSPALSRSSP